MGTEAVAGFVSIQKAIRSFLHVEVELRALSPSSPRTVRIDRAFVDFLVRRDVAEAEAFDLLQRHADHLEHRLAVLLHDWSEFDGPVPVARLPEDPNRLVFWSNPRFGELTGLDPLPAAVVEAHDWLARNAQPGFLRPALCYLRAIGCDRIFVTDSKGDEGIDCIGRIGRGGLRSTAVFVQAKSSFDHVTTEQLGVMFARYASLPSTPAYGRYLDALGVRQEPFGSSRLFVVVAQGGFREGARELAWRSGALLRPGRLVAQVLGSHYPPGALQAVSDRLQLPVGADLQRDLAPELDA